MTFFNNTPEGIITLITSGIVLMGSLIIGWEGYKKRVNLYTFFFASFLSWALNFLFYGLSRFTLNKTYVIFQYLFIVFAFFFLIIAIDYAMRERISSIKMLLFGGLGTLVVYLTFLPESIIDSLWYGYPSFEWAGMLRIFGIIVILLYGLFLVYFSIITYIKCPNYLKKNAIILLSGSFIAGVIGVVIYIFIDTVFTAAIGTSIMTIAFAREPKIFFVLPYKVDRLTVIQNKSGITLFDYKWADSEIPDVLLGGLLQGVKNISVEVIQKGELKEIILTNGTLLFFLDRHITVGLLISKTSNYLRKCLKQFSIAFEQEFDKDLSLMQEFVEASRFNSAIKLVEFYFPHIPSEFNQHK